MDAFFDEFRQSYASGSGSDLARTLLPSSSGTDLNRLDAFFYGTDEGNVESDIRSHISYSSPYIGYRIGKQECKAWTEVYIAFWRFLRPFLSSEAAAAAAAAANQEADWAGTYTAWRDVANALIKNYSSGHFQAWTIPCLYVAGRYLRVFAIKADEQATQSNGDATFNSGYQDDIADESSRNEKLEDAARVINRIFTLCISDRAPLEESRKWGLYFTTDLLFKTYFRLNSIGLCKNILRALSASQTDMPPLESFPKSHTVTFWYYVGIIHFLEEDYAKAEEYLTQAWQNCHKDARKNLELILTYLIPCHLLTTHTLPSAALLRPYSHLRALFGPICSAIKRGDLAGFDAALTAGEDAFVRRRIYLTLERGRDIALRNLFRKVFVAGGFEEPKEPGGEKTRRTRIPVAEFAAAVRLGSDQDSRSSMIEDDEVECLLANLIYKNLIKGYISRERATVVLSKAGTAFPGTGV